MKKILAFGLAVATAVTMMGCAAQTPSGKVTLPDEEPSTLLATELAAPVIPEMAQYPQEMDYYDEKTGEWTMSRGLRPMRRGTRTMRPERRTWTPRWMAFRSGFCR